MNSSSNTTNISTELRFMWYHFNKIKSFIENGLPQEFSKLLVDNPETILENGKKYIVVPVNYKKHYKVVNHDGDYYIYDNKQSKIIENIKDNSTSLGDVIYVRIENTVFGQVIYGPTKSEVTEKTHQTKKSDEITKFCFNNETDEFNVTQKIKKQYNWKLNINPTDEEVFDAINDFFHFCKFKFSDKNSALFPVILQESLRISSGLEFPKDDKVPSIIPGAEVLFHHFYKLIFPKKDEKEETFENRIESFCDNLSNSVITVQNVKNVLSLLRWIRNGVSHNCIRRQRYNEVVFTLYIFIFLFFLVRKVELLKNNKENKDFFDYIEQSKNEYYLDVCIDNNRNRYKPFTEWNSGNHKGIFTLDYQNAEIKNGIPYTKEYIYSIPGVPDSSNSIIAKMFKEAMDNTNEGNQSIYEELAKIVSSLNGEKGLQKQLEDLQRKTTPVIVKIKKLTRIVKLTILILVLLCSVLFGVNYTFNKYAEPLFYRTGYEFFLQKAHVNGAHDLAYDHALALEKEGRVKDACYWYAKAKERYAEIVSVNPDDSEAAYRLAQMLIRLKGGSDNLTADCQNALYYAKIAAKDYGYGLYIYINLIMGNKGEACQGMLEIEDGNSIQDDYSKLAHILMQLHDIGIGDKEPLHTQDKVVLLEQLEMMCIESNKDAKQEAVTQWYYLLMNGLKMDGTYIMGCDFYEAQALVRQNMNNVPLLVSYLTYDAYLYNNYSLLEQVLEKLWQNETRFVYPQLHDFIKRKMISEPSYMKELNANIIQTDSLSVFEAVRRYNLNIRHNHLQEETFSYIQYAVNLAASDPMILMNKKTLLISFLIGKDSISVKDLETLPFVHEKSEALCNYLMGIKYAKGCGVKENMKQADSYFMAAADKGLEIAHYTWAVRLYKQGKRIPAIRMLKPLAEKWDIARIWLAYMMKDLDPQSFYEYLEQVENQYHPYVTASISAELVKTENQQSIKLMHFILRNSIGESMDCPEKIAILAGYLSQIVPITNIDESLFYAYWAINLEKEIGYQFFPALAEGLKMMERPDLADRLIKDMCMAYFRKNGSTLDDKNKEAVVSLLKNEYPYLVNQIATEIGYNPVPSVDLNKNRKELIEPDFSMTLLPDECILDLLNE